MTIALGFVFGVLAVFAAIRSKAAAVRPLGASFFGRFLAIQAGLINAVLLAIVLQIAKQLAWQGPVAVWAVPVGYGVLFFFYSLSNIDWTVKKFHSEGS